MKGVSSFLIKSGNIQAQGLARGKLLGGLGRWGWGANNYGQLPRKIGSVIY